MTVTAVAEGKADESEAFYARCVDAWGQLFDAAKAKNELDFAFALFPEFRGMQSVGWNTANDALTGLADYLEVIEKLEWSRGRIRVCLALYNHLFEASGLYEIPKNMLNIIEAGYFQMQPFRHIVRENRVTGQAISPNAKAVMQELLGHAKRLGFDQLVDLIATSFNAAVRHGYAHADYVVLNEAIRFPQRNGGGRSSSPVEISFYC